jgi:hypothetical protein
VETVAANELSAKNMQSVAAKVIFTVRVETEVNMNATPILGRRPGMPGC